ncbi:MAG: hypothetical protein LWW88_05970 [Acinetobacter sp.]|uniref:hypothetical protein n=1 Tax=Acinetobacter sp. TaxID=472 RepID=UPI00258B4C1D|nr:hypothetical protein [Acinetobacter sp.]MCE1271098.1 hypothetical protein [Acinetobacter sp.]
METRADQSSILRASKKVPVIGTVITAVTLAPSVAEAAQGKKTWAQFCSDLLADFVGAGDAN